MNDQPDYNYFFDELKNLSLFDLWRLDGAIKMMLDDPQRQINVKRHLRQGMSVSYFIPEENRLIDAVVIQIKRTRALLKNKHNDKMWDIPFYMINLAEVDTTIHSNRTSLKLDRVALKIGDQVGWHSKYGVDLHGEVIKLNPKKAKIKLSTGEIWQVPYSMLFLVVDGLAQSSHTGLVIEGEVTLVGDPLS